MLRIICNEELRPFFRGLISRAGISGKWQDVALICDRHELEASISSHDQESPIIIEVALSWNGNYLQHFYGFDVAAYLRRSYLLKSAIIFFSPLKKSYFERPELNRTKASLLNAPGSGFISFPPSVEIYNQQLSDTKPLDDDALRNVIIEHCGIKKEWRAFSHKIGNTLSNLAERREALKKEVKDWAKTINLFAPDQVGNLKMFQDLLDLPPEAVNTDTLKRALERLDDGLQGNQPAPSDISLSTLYRQLPKCPPKGFSKVLIADDEPQPFLINSLRSEFGYIVVEQAFKLTQAKELLIKYKPDVVLSDYYFKESSRETEVPDKSIGDRFIQYALTHPQYAKTDPMKPIVLVTSKATLRTETDIRVGAINCSGASRATDPIYIHSVIWAEAKKRGAFQPEEIYGQEWTLEHNCRQRLEQFREDIPKLIKQWKEFKNTVRDTLRLCHLLSQSPMNDDPEIVRQVIGVLEAYETLDDFPFGTVTSIFTEIEEAHRFARTPPRSYSKQAIRNILHGRIEQFSSVTNAVKFLLTALSSVANDLASLAQYQHLGKQLKSNLSKYSESEPLLPVLTLLNDNLIELLANLPELPSAPVSTPSERDVVSSNNINIVVVEDNDFWRDFIFSAIEKTKSRLGEIFAIRYQHVDNAADALAAIPSTNKSFAINGSDRIDAKTIAIVDICLPENREHAERIRAALEGRIDQLETPRSTHGLDLIRTLSSYKDNVPLVIFTTIDSIEDRKAIGSWGVSDADFLVKGIDDEEAIMRSLIRKIEKRTKYVIERFDDESGNSRFRINGITILFPRELERTFSALYTLCQTTGRNEFSISEIMSTRGYHASDKSKKVIQDQIYRIRNLILKTLRTNRVYVNVRDLMKTIKSPDGNEFSYQLNAEVMSIDDEGDYETDLESYKNETCRVLVIDGNPQTLGRIVEPLESLGYEVKYATNVEDAVRAAKEFLPHIVSLDLLIPHKGETESLNVSEGELGGLEAWRQIRMSLSANTVGIVVPTAKTDKNYLVAQAAQLEIPIRNFISISEENWLNLFLKKVSDERRRVFLGEITDATKDIDEPIVEISEGSDLSKGILNLIVNGKPFKMKVSPIAKIIGLLLAKPKTLISFESIKSDIGSNEPITTNDLKNWPKRIKEIIRNKWLMGRAEVTTKELAEKILESSSRGMLLNAQVIDLRTKRIKSNAPVT